jgi:hypothetical protein
MLPAVELQLAIRASKSLFGPSFAFVQGTVFNGIFICLCVGNAVININTFINFMDIVLPPRVRSSYVAVTIITRPWFPAFSN